MQICIVQSAVGLRDLPAQIQKFWNAYSDLNFK